MTKGNRRGGQRGSRPGGKPRTVISLTSSEAFERQLAIRTDSAVVHGKFAFTSATVGTTVIDLFTLNPVNFGARLSQVSGTFSRYRIKELRFRFLTTVTSGGYVALGLTDDDPGASIPTTAAGVVELRCSATSFSAETIPTELVWRPLDPTRWMYLSTDTTNANRFEDSGTLWVASNQAGSGFECMMDFTVVFAGAFDGGSSVSLTQDTIRLPSRPSDPDTDFEDSVLVQSVKPHAVAHRPVTSARR